MHSDGQEAQNNQLQIDPPNLNLSLSTGELTRSVNDPSCVPLDNNAERALRGPVVGRKNHYGSRSVRGTQVAAIFYTLCETARLVDSRRRSAGVPPARRLRGDRAARRCHLS